MENLKPIIESLLFVAEEPMTVVKLSNILEVPDKKEIRAALETLQETYDSRQGGFHLCQVAGGWQLRSRPEYHEYIKRMLQPSPHRLSRAALETLAIVAYKQPVIRSDVEYIRGVDSGGVLRQLMERKLIRVLGRKEIPGRPLIYATTKLFLELFDLKDLKDLPSPKEIEALSGSLNTDSDAQEPTKIQDLTSDQNAADTPAETENVSMPHEARPTDMTEKDPAADIERDPNDARAVSGDPGEKQLSIQSDKTDDRKVNDHTPSPKNT